MKRSTYSNTTEGRILPCMKRLALGITLLTLAGCSLLLGRAPYCHFTYSPARGPAPLTVVFHAGGSHDFDGWITTFSWSFGDNSTAYGQRVSHTYTAQGTHRVCLTVCDDDGHTATACGNVVVEMPAYDMLAPRKAAYPRTAYGARLFVSDVRPPNWTYSWNPHIQMPDVSYAALRGDCDDFAVMVAFYLQEYWGYDTFVTILRPILGVALESHAVCFVRASQVLVDLPGTYSCGVVPVLDDPSGRRYRPVDFSPCPGWSWNVYRRECLRIYDLFTEHEKYTCAFEWYDMIYIDQFNPLAADQPKLPPPPD